MMFMVLIVSIFWFKMRYGVEMIFFRLIEFS